ncbi:MAG: VWA domain-containing protein [bacterium]|nr:VWA domain-containing protein [bacterium]
MKINPIKMLLLILLCLTFFIWGCGETFSPDSGGGPFSNGSNEFGATQGGVQDMGLARELISNGLVPPAPAFTVEGMFSEHDLPIEGESNNSILNLNGALGYAPDLSGEDSGWVQIGMSSNIDPETFERPSLSFVACVDVSGSMGWPYSGEGNEYPTPGSITRALLTRLTEQLDENDRVGMVTYGADVSVFLNPISADSPQVAAAIAGLSSNGSTNMEAGLQRAFAMAQSEMNAETDDVRVLLFTDVQPNVGATSPGSFREMAENAADEQIGMTVFGVGVGMGQEVMNAISDNWGGNAYSLFTPNDVNELVEMNWPWMVAPIAHGLSLEISTPTEFSVNASFGFPGPPGEDLGFTVASVFPSPRKGALLACLKPDEGISFAGATISGNLSFTTISGENIHQELTWNFPEEIPEENGQYFDQPAVAKTVALAIMVSGMKSSAEQYQDDPEAAVELMQQVSSRIEADAAAFGDDSLDAEVALAASLLLLMESGAEQGDMYGW